MRASAGSGEQVPQQVPPAAGPIGLTRGSDGSVSGAPVGGGMSRRATLSLAAGLAACPCCADVALASGNAKFDYGTLSGPINWGGTCAAGTRQSPIDIPAKAVSASTKRMSSGAGNQGPMCKPATLDPRGYKPVKPRILNTGVGTMQVRGVDSCVCA